MFGSQICCGQFCKQGTCLIVTVFIHEKRKTIKHVCKTKNKKEAPCEKSEKGESLILFIEKLLVNTHWTGVYIYMLVGPTIQ